MHSLSLVFVASPLSCARGQFSSLHLLGQVADSTSRRKRMRLVIAGMRPRAAAVRKRPDVFFRQAFKRLAGQRTIGQALRAGCFLAAFALEQIRDTLVIGVPALPRLVQATRRRNRIQLDEHTFIDIYEPLAKDETRGHPVVVYVHGGAWGQGESWNFSVIGVGLSETYARCTALVLSYSLYPVALMQDQVASVVLALQYARRTFPQRKIACVAHSSGAHISSLAFLRTAPDCAESGQPLADVFVAQAGVYHVARHFLFEASRCLAFVSPMLPASGGGEEPDGNVFDSVSPLCKLDGRCVLRSESMVQSTVASQLEGAVVARCMVEMTKRGVANASATSSELKTQLMPQVFVQAAVADLTVPTTSNSIPFYDKLTQSGLTNSHLLLYEGQMGHGDFIVDWLQGSKLVRREAQREFFDVGAEMQQRRKIARHVYGASARTIDTVGAGDLELAPAAHIRDLCRILENMEP